MQSCSHVGPKLRPIAVLDKFNGIDEKAEFAAFPPSTCVENLNLGFDGVFGAFSRILFDLEACVDFEFNALKNRFLWPSPNSKRGQSLIALSRGLEANSA